MSLVLQSNFTFAEAPLEEVVVDAEFVPRGILSTSASVSVLNEVALRRRDARHIEDVLNIIPNMNSASGASRGRFFQIRGIGERSQFSDPVNYSVGLVVDGIDFTGIGSAANVLDVKQVEVLRGPQGTLYGANALAGLVNIVTNDPSAAGGGETSLTLGEYNTRQFSQVVSGPISDTLGLRIAFGKNLSDGYTDNKFLQRDDTANIDESTLRSKLNWNISERHNLKFTAIFIEVDNGYDGFSLDNTRETLSDEPGQDRLVSRAFSLQHEFHVQENLQWQTLVSGAHSDSEYAYDEDWTFREICSIDSDCAFFQYSTKDNYARDLRNITFDSRILWTDPNSDLNWVAGVYARDQQEALARTYTNNDPSYGTFYGPITAPEISNFSNDYDTRNVAVYSQISYPINSRATLEVGGRLENRRADYGDSNGELIDDDENFWGGKISLEYQATDRHFLYAMLSRGYKAGSNNVPSLKDDLGNDLIPIFYDSENLLNYELGHKAQWLEGALETQVSAFYQDRNNIQVKQALVLCRESGAINETCSGSSEFIDYTDNAAEGINYGIEFEMRGAFSPNFQAWLNLGLLATEFKDFESYSHVNAAPLEGIAVDLSGEEQAHAPNYQLALGFDWELLPYFSWSSSVETKDGFSLSPRHNARADSIALWNSRISYYRDNWTLSFWGKNINNELVIVRGFGSFGNDPRKGYVLEPYYQYGAPRTVGISASLRFQ